MNRSRRIRRPHSDPSDRSPANSLPDAAPTFRPGMILLVVILAASLGVALYVWFAPGSPETPGARQAARPITTKAAAPQTPPASARPTPPATSTTAQTGDPAALAPKTAGQPLRKRAMPLPSTLLTRLNDDQSFWYVGSYTTPSQVEIPFPPGQQPAPPPTLAATRENPGFLGAQACQSCHQDKYDTFIETAHHLSSRPADETSIAGSFEPGKNRMQTKNPKVSFTMIARGDRHYQRVNFFDWEFEVPFDLVIGSSKLGQAFAYWDYDSLYQTHVTYLTETDSWTNSPGYLDGDAAYARPIRGRCLECHSTYADVGNRSNHYVPNSLILGISCERCHGPGKAHVEYHQQHTTEKESRYVMVPSKLSRERQMDVCGQCHSGGSSLKGQPYSFRPGDRLEEHYHAMDDADHQNSVHASNQASRLALSACFKNSQMACVDCHNPHRNERGQAALFSSRCIKCHSPQDCGSAKRVGDRIRENCIDCHMPRQASNTMQLETSAGDIFPPLRDHHIRIDAEATARYFSQVPK